MRGSTLAALAALSLAGCTGFGSFQPATSPDEDGPTANVADQVVRVSTQRLHVFEITQVDGRRLSSTSMATLRGKQEGGFAAVPVALTNELPLRAVRVRLQATTQYASPLLALQSPTCRVQGDVDFTPEAGKAYRVAGRVAAEACEAWIEDLATQQPVTQKVSGKGTGP
jgi:hypothetical protein